jgi:formate C-acetyltransferase
MSEDYTFEARLKALREKKEAQTLKKLELFGYMDEDDYGSVPPPEGFEFVPEFNDKVNNTFYGAKLWGKNFRALMEAHPVYVDPNDALAGRWMFILQRLRPFDSVTSVNNMEMAPEFDYSHLKPTQEKYGLLPGIGKMHHFAPDYHVGLELGWGGLLEKVRKYRALSTPEQEEFYQAEEDVLIGICNWIERTIAEIRKMEATETDPARKENLWVMAETNEWILTNPPRTLREAAQWIAWFNMANRTYNRAGAGCQLDEMLRPYYEYDKRENGLTDEEAKFIIACLLLVDPHYYQIGGPDKNGKDVTSPMSYLILEAAHALKSSANLTIRVHDGMDERLFERGLEILFEDKKAYPRFSGDKALVSGFMKNNYSAELARERIAVGCNWMSLPGTEYTLNDLVKVNIAKVFEVAFHEYQEKEDRGVTEGLFELFEKHLTLAVNCLKEGIDFHFKHQYKNAPELMLNLVCHGPIEKGLDASNGGVDYYNIAIDGAGLATTADSFAAIEQWVEKDKQITWEECQTAVRNNFTGAEKIRSMLASTEMYGHGNSLADKWALRISKMFTDLVANERTPDGYLTIPGLFSWANTVPFGKDVGATPNGRYSGEPISHGANPHPGFRKDGAFTAMAKAIAAVQPGYGNTAPFQLELNPTMVDTDDAIKNVGAVIKGHFDLGGTLVNVNIMDAEMIREANKNPEKYPDLIVRVTGFSAYFVTLSPEFRQLVVDRIVDDI